MIDHILYFFGLVRARKLEIAEIQRDRAEDEAVRLMGLLSPHEECGYCRNSLPGTADDICSSCWNETQKRKLK